LGLSIGSNYAAALVKLTKDPVALARLKRMWGDAKLFLIDEGGFWTCGRLLFASRAISIALGLGQDVVFGNRDVIMSADFFQNPPPSTGSYAVAQAMVWATMRAPELADTTRQENAAAIEVSKMFSTFIRYELTEQIRAKHDHPHINNISDIRNTRVRCPASAKVMRLYKALSKDDMLQLAFRQSQFVVTGNSERVRLARVRLVQFARDTARLSCTGTTQSSSRVGTSCRSTFCRHLQQRCPSSTGILSREQRHCCAGTMTPWVGWPIVRPA